MKNLVPSIYRVVECLSVSYPRNRLSLRWILKRRCNDFGIGAVCDFTRTVGGYQGMLKKYYRVWLKVEEVEESTNPDGKLIEQIELAAFHTLEEALTYRYELSQKYSPRVTGESEVIRQMTTPETFAAGD